MRGKREKEKSEQKKGFFPSVVRRRRFASLALSTFKKKKSLLTSKRATATTGPTGPSPTEQEKQPRERHQREEQVPQEGGVVPLGVALGDGDVDAGAGEDVYEVGVVGEDDESATAVDGRQLELGAVLGEAHALHFAGGDRVDELRVAPLVPFGERPGILQSRRGRGGKGAGVRLRGSRGLLLRGGGEVEGEGRGGRGEGGEGGEARGGEELEEGVELS